LAIEFAGDDPSRVVVLSIPDWGVTPFAAGHNRDVIASEIDRFNQLKRERVAVRGCQFIDVTSISRQAADDRTLLADDGLHPSAKMYACWCQLALPAVRKATFVTFAESD
jgi:lysophospholipase L1-like esterase